MAGEGRLPATVVWHHLPSLNQGCANPSAHAQMRRVPVANRSCIMVRIHLTLVLNRRTSTETISLLVNHMGVSKPGSSAARFVVRSSDLDEQDIFGLPRE